MCQIFIFHKLQQNQIFTNYVYRCINNSLFTRSKKLSNNRDVISYEEELQIREM